MIRERMIRAERLAKAAFCSNYSFETVLEECMIEFLKDLGAAFVLAFIVGLYFLMAFLNVAAPIAFVAVLCVKMFYAGCPCSWQAILSIEFICACVFAVSRLIMVSIEG